MTSERSTMRLHVGQNSGWRRRVWHSLWSWLKLMRSLRGAVNNRIGIEISPKGRCPFQTLLAMATLLLAHRLGPQRRLVESRRCCKTGTRGGSRHVTPGGPETEGVRRAPGAQEGPHDPAQTLPPQAALRPHA